MKKVLLYTDTPQSGGAELQMFLLAKFLNKESFMPIVVASDNDGLKKWFDNLEKEDISTIKLNVKHKHDPRHYSLLKKIIKEQEIDIFHAHVWNPASCRYAFLAAKHTKTPLVTTEHDPFKISFFKDLFKKYLQKDVQKIVTVSNENKNLINKLYPAYTNIVEVIHNGIDSTWWQSQLLRFTDQDRREIKEKTFHAHENTLIITTISTLHERKGVKFLIKSLPPIVEKFNNIKLAIIGSGPEKKNLESITKRLNLERHVVFTGQQQNTPHLLKSSDIFVLPSKREAFGMVNLEAMITGLPVIATKVGGIPEIIEHKKTGLLVEPENPQALSEAIKSLIDNPEKRTQLAQAGKEKVLKEFEAKKMAEKYEQLYNSALS